MTPVSINIDAIVKRLELHGKNIWTSSNVARVLEEVRMQVRESLPEAESFQIRGNLPPWLLLQIVSVVDEEAINESDESSDGLPIDVYDPKLQKCFEVTGAEPQGEGDTLQWTVKQDGAHTVVGFCVPGGFVDASDLKELIPPEVDLDKTVVISGRGPHWLMTLIGYAYRKAPVVAFRNQSGSATVALSPKCLVPIGQQIFASLETAMPAQQYGNNGKKHAVRTPSPAPRKMAAPARRPAAEKPKPAVSHNDGIDYGANNGIDYPRHGQVFEYSRGNNTHTGVVVSIDEINCDSEHVLIVPLMHDTEVNRERLHGCKEKVYLHGTGLAGGGMGDTMIALPDALFNVSKRKLGKPVGNRVPNQELNTLKRSIGVVIGAFDNKLPR